MSRFYPIPSNQRRGMCVRFLHYNHALAYNYKFWTSFLPCSNVDAHNTENVPSPICPTRDRNLANQIQSKEVQEKNKRRIQPPRNQTHDLKCKTKRKGLKQARGESKHKGGKPSTIYTALKTP